MTNREKLDGAAAKLSGDGFVMDSYHRLKDSSSSNPDGKIYSNFIKFTPKVSMEELVLNCKSVATTTETSGRGSSKKTYYYYSRVGIVDVTNKTGDILSTDSFCTVDVNTSST